jgi:hypothetical protein
LRAGGRFGRRVEENVIGRFLACGDPQHGFARIYCDQCRHACILAFSCKARYFCPSCHQKRVLAYGEWVDTNVLAPVPHRQYVFTVPRLLRPLFARRLAQYMLRAPFSLEKMSYEPVSGIVIYRSRMHKTFKRNFQIMSGADWLVQLCRHIPDRFEHLVRYAGWYSNRSRGKRRRMEVKSAEVATCEIDDREAAHVRSTGARLIHKVYEVDPLE